MKLTRDDIVLMRTSLITLAGAIVLSSSLLIFANKQSEQARAENHTAQQQLHRAQSALIVAQQAQLDRQTYEADYWLAVTQHLIGDEARMDWMDTLENLRAHYSDADFHYQIAAQKPYASQPDSGNFTLVASTMTWHLTLRHEAQLLDFLDALHQQSHGQFLTTGCALKRNADLLSADCTGDWLTLQPHPVP
ncbi:MAG: hypothetical protein WCD45_10590 [Gallionella sp.]